MGTEGNKLIGMDIGELVELLNKALADEWLAYYQYWIGSKIAKGRMRPEVTKELVEHAGEELQHAEMLADRIVQLGGQPVLEPKKWYDITNCGYEIPSDPATLALVKQNIKGEQCAIKTYKALADKVKGKDAVTYLLVIKILEDEIEHEDDLEAILEDLGEQ